jgi:hypothetical protein
MAYGTRLYMHGDRVAVAVSEGYVIGEVLGACGIDAGRSVIGVSRDDGGQIWRDERGGRMDVYVIGIDLDLAGAQMWLETGEA